MLRSVRFATVGAALAALLTICACSQSNDTSDDAVAEKGGSAGRGEDGGAGGEAGTTETPDGGDFGIGGEAAGADSGTAGAAGATTEDPFWMTVTDSDFVEAATALCELYWECEGLQEVEDCVEDMTRLPAGTSDDCIQAIADHNRCMVVPGNTVCMGERLAIWNRSCPPTTCESPEM